MNADLWSLLAFVGLIVLGVVVAFDIGITIMNAIIGPDDAGPGEHRLGGRHRA